MKKKSNYYWLILISTVLGVLTLVTPIFWSRSGVFYYFIFGLIYNPSYSSTMYYNPDFFAPNVPGTLMSYLVIAAIVILTVALFYSKINKYRLRVFLPLISGVLLISSLSIYLMNLMSELNFFDSFQFNFLGQGTGLLVFLGAIIEFFAHWTGDESKKEQVLVSLQHREKMYQNMRKTGICITSLGILSSFANIFVLNTPAMVSFFSMYPVAIFLTFLPELSLIIPGLIFIFFKQIILSRKLKKLDKS